MTDILVPCFAGSRRHWVKRGHLRSAFGCATSVVIAVEATTAQRGPGLSMPAESGAIKAFDMGQKRRIGLQLAVARSELSKQSSMWEMRSGSRVTHTVACKMNLSSVSIQLSVDSLAEAASGIQRIRSSIDCPPDNLEIGTGRNGRSYPSPLSTDTAWHDGTVRAN